jgi:hypothetical protein
LTEVRPFGRIDVAKANDHFSSAIGKALFFEIASDCKVCAQGGRARQCKRPPARMLAEYKTRYNKRL